MKTSARSSFCAAVLTLAATYALAAVPQARITAPIDNTQRAELPGTLSPHAHPANDMGALAPNTQLSSMTLVFSRTAAQQQALDTLIVAQQDPTSPQYHHFLTPEQFGAQFGAADADIAKAEAWLQQQGFTINGVSRSHDRVSFSGNAAQVASAFGTELHNYTTTVGTRFAPSTALHVPSALASSVLTVTNLSNFRPRPHIKVTPAAVRPSPNYTSGQTGSIFLGPKDIATIYDVNTTYNAGYNGKGQSIAIVGQSAIVPSDITAFQTGFGYTAKPPTQLLVPNTLGSTIYENDESESDLDLEYSGAMAPGATIYFVYVGASQTAGVFDALTYAVQNAIAPIVSISYGACELDVSSSEYAQLNGVLQQAATQGQTVISASGDTGSTDCWEDTTDTTTTREALSADFPTSSQYVTGVGGTEIPTANLSSTYFTAASGGADVISSAKSYIPEQVWNDDAAAVAAGDIGTNGVTVLNSGGGGTSIYTARPTWQTGAPNIPSGTFRLTPDVALLASDFNAPYIYCSSDPSAWSQSASAPQRSSCTSGLRDASSQDFTLAGGTSFAAPIFAGLVAVLNQAKGYTTGQGLINPTLYSLASNSTTYASAFHDITVGGNECAAGTTYCSTAGATYYLAGTGYDEASGLGSIDLTNLVAAWPASTTLPTTASFSLTATAVTETAGTAASTTVTVTPANGFTGNVKLTAYGPANLVNACYSLATAAVTGTSAVTATISVTTNQSSCATGTSPLIKTTTLASHKTPHANDSSSHISLAALALGSIATLFFTRRRKALRSLQGAALLFILTLAAFGTASLTGCSNGSSGAVSTTTTTNTSVTPAGTYTITVTGSAGTNSSNTATTTFNLTVN